MKKAALIGTGFIADFHASAYAALEDVRLCAVCDCDGQKAQTFAQEYQCRAYTDAAEMLANEKPDYVSVCVPTFLHYQFTCMALEAGAHVLCEKPMALTMDECRLMADTARRCDRRLMVGQVLRFWPEYVSAAQQIRRMGIPNHLSMKRLQHASRITWLLDPQLGGGAMFDLFVHDLDYACSLFGTDAQVVYANATKGTQGSYRRIHAVLEWQNGAQVQIESSNMMPVDYPFTAKLRAEYDQACLQYGFQAPLNIQKDAVTQTEFVLFENDGIQALPIEPKAQSRAFDAEIAAFVLGCQSGKMPIEAEETLRVMEIIRRVCSMVDKQP